MALKGKVALISPGTEQVFAVHEPINLGFLASYLEKQGYEVKIIDQLGGQNVEEELAAFKPDLAGITATTPVIYEAYKIAQLAKKMGILTVMGGIHATMFPEEALKHADIVVKGEGEKALVEILENNIKSGVVLGSPIMNLDEIPPPARHLMLMKERYLYCKKRVPYIGHLPRVPANKRIIHMITSRGCPHARCIYCHNSTKNIPYRANSPERVIEEIKLLRKQFDVEVIYFMEDNFFAEKKRVMKICELMIREKLDYIDWGGTIRVEQVDEEMLAASKKAGAKWVGIGFESGSQRILDILSKGIKIEQSVKAVEIVRKVGLIPHGNAMLGNPTETLEDVEMTRNFLFKNKVVLPEIYIYTPYPGTKAWEMVVANKLVPPADKIDWRIFTQERIVMNLSAMTKEQIEKGRARLLLQYYLSHPVETFNILKWILLFPAAPLTKALKIVSPLFRLKKKEL